MNDAFPGPDLTLVILAAGRSRRFGRPKPLEPLGPHGETLPQYLVHDGLQAGFRRIVFIVHPDTADPIRAHMTMALPAAADLSFVLQDPVPPVPHRSRPWGTGAAILAAAERVDGPFAVANADDLYGPDAFAAAARHLRVTRRDETPGHALIGFRLRNTLSPAGGVSRAVCQVTASGDLLGIEEVLDVRATAHGIAGHAAGSGEPRALVGSELVSMNLWAFHPDIFSGLAEHFARFLARHGSSAEAEFLIGDAVQAMVADGSARVRVLACGAAWHGITHAADREPFMREIARRSAAGSYPSPLPGHRGSA